MRKVGIIILFCVFILLCYFTFESARKVFRSDWHLLKVNQQKANHRLVLITQDMETPFWNKVANGALRQAEKNGVSLEVWGSYSNKEDFLKKMEIAIHSKVDGIIVQGLDTEEFKQITKIKASSYGIPVITVANDVPMSDSLRKTYIGSDQYKAGQLIATQLLADMGTTGEVVLMYDRQQEYYQIQRLNGIQDVLKQHPNVQTVFAETSDSREEIVATTQGILNRVPEVDAFIAVDAEVAGAMIQELGKRFQVEPFYIFSFDDGTESLSLLKQGKLDGLIEQSPEKMGEKSVQLLMEWLNGETVPLNSEGYFTDIHILKATDMK
ncbi:sugar ABC transporter substrate-binding protein [Bacillus sp. MRMR6]|uniref:sugar ABC transporter substrate-binding protein n=1 Tax=Bacillus sp. MRMR6 TaxID=1928617 RepID=UPI0009518DC7|nr:sugar ABC transporter substrate-binding protein [Bacillus sp. MRMR6]OLS39252.1 sugar ABC transporter substrate-binding protein [Bacillus sp. MRMR6]